MATLEYADYAVEQLGQYLEETLPTYVTQVNTQQSDIDVTLAQMKTYARGLHPFSVELLPRLELEFQSIDPAEPAGWKNQIYDVEIGVIVVVGYEDADLIEGQKNLRRYITAVMRAVEADPQLETADASRVIEAEFLTAGASGAVSELGRLYGLATINFRVQVHEV